MHMNRLSILLHHLFRYASILRERTRSLIISIQYWVRRPAPSANPRGDYSALGRRWVCWWEETSDRTSVDRSADGRRLLEGRRTPSFDGTIQSIQNFWEDGWRGGRPICVAATEVGTLDLASVGSQVGEDVGSCIGGGRPAVHGLERRRRLYHSNSTVPREQLKPFYWYTLDTTVDELSRLEQELFLGKMRSI